MALNNCFNSPTCTSMTEHLGGIGSPAEALSLVPEAFVITSARIYQSAGETAYRGRQSSRSFFPPHLARIRHCA